MRDRSVFRPVALFVIVAASVVSRPTYTAPVPVALAGFPDLVLWAWERPESLEQLDPDVGVAFLAQTISLTPGHEVLEPRRQPLKVAPTTALLATTRIEAARVDGSAFSRHQADTVAMLIARTSELPGVAGIQIDFDATLSQRPFYRSLIASLRRRVPSLPVSITALASWCVEDRWLHDLDVDEVVPAIFRMGPGNQKFRDLGAGGSWPAAECRAAVGTSLDEPVALGQARRRVYVFSPAPWSSRAVASARALVSR